MKNKVKYILFWTITIFFIAIVPIDSILRVKYHCTSPLDFAIYQQAIYDISAGNSLNPFVTVRGVNIFNDHADPIIFLAAGFLRLFGQTPTNLIVFEWLVWLSLIFSVWLLKGRPSFRDHSWMLTVTILVFCRAFLKGLEYPIHPTTWAMLPATLLSYFLIHRKFYGVFICSFLCILCKESFPFMVIGLSGFYFIQKDWRKFLALFLLGISFVTVYSILRPIYLGPVVNYGGGILKRLVLENIVFIYHAATELVYPKKEFLPILLSIFFILGKQIKALSDFRSHPFTGVFLFTFTGFFIHLLATQLQQHHIVPIAAPLLGFIIFSNYFDLKYGVKWLIPLTVVVFLLTSSSRYKRMLRMVFNKDSSGQCYTKEDKLVPSQQLYSFFKSVPLEKEIFASGGVIVPLMKPGIKIYPSMDWVRLPKHFDFIVMEKNSNGSIWPLTNDHIEEIMLQCKEYASKVHIDNEFFHVMEGKFPIKCTGHFDRFSHRPKKNIKDIGHLYQE